MNKRTIITAIASVIAFILLTINTLAGTDFQMSEEVIQSIAILIFVGISWAASHWFNQDYTSVANKITPIMRMAKKLEKQGDLTLLDQIMRLVEGGDDDDN